MTILRSVILYTLLVGLLLTTFGLFTGIEDIILGGFALFGLAAIITLITPRTKQ